MSDPARVDLFAEDSAHEALLMPLIRRLAQEEAVAVDVIVRSAQGGHGRVITEYELYQESVERGALSYPDLAVVAIDANCKKFHRASREIADATRPGFTAVVTAACPDPHIERWFMADPASFAQIVGAAPRVRKGKCVRDYYKAALGSAVREGGNPDALGGLEFARELASAMDLYRAGRAERSLKAFVDRFRAHLRRIRTGNEA